MNKYNEFWNVYNRSWNEWIWMINDNVQIRNVWTWMNEYETWINIMKLEMFKLETGMNDYEWTWMIMIKFIMLKLEWKIWIMI